MARGKSGEAAAAAQAAAEGEKKVVEPAKVEGVEAAEAPHPDEALGAAFDAGVDKTRKEKEDARKAEEDAKRAEEETKRAADATTREQEAERIRRDAETMAAEMNPAPTKADRVPIHRSSWLRRELGSGTSTDVDVFAILGRKIANFGANAVFNPMIRVGTRLQNWGAKNPFLSWLFKVQPTEKELADIVPPPGGPAKRE